MSLPKILGAYDDCLDHYESALKKDKGIRVQFIHYGDAKYFTLRMGQARVLVREEAKRIYANDHPMWGRSEFDKLQVKMPAKDTEGRWWVYIIPHGSVVETVEDVE